jgi:hypothetical protein
MKPEIYSKMRELGLPNRWTLQKASNVVKKFRAEMREIKDANTMVMAEAITLSGDAVIETASLKLLMRINQLGSLEATKLHDYMVARAAYLSAGYDPADLPEIPESIKRMLSMGDGAHVNLMIEGRKQ